MTVCVGLRVAGALYALPVEHVREIAELGALAPVPGAGAAVLGVRNLRGQVLPVFDLARVLGGNGAPARIVVAEDGDRRAGLAIDEVTDVGEPPAGATVLDVRQLFASLEERAAP